MTGTPSKANSARLTSGHIGLTIMGMALPMTWGIFAMMAFHVIDMWYISRLGTIPLAAISFTFPVSMVIHSVSMGLGAGASSAISRAIGQADSHRVRRLTTDALFLGVLIVLIFASVGILLLDPIFRTLGADGQTLVLIKQYMQIWLAGTVFVVVPMIGNHSLRASGNAIIPSIIMTIGAVINLILDPIFIFGLFGFPRLELRGAALATLIGRASTLVISLCVLHYREQMLSFAKPLLREMIASFRAILHVGFPAAGMHLIFPVSMAIVTRLIAGFGDEAVAAFGVGSRIEGFALIPLWAMATSISPFSGQNWGAGQFQRLKLGYRFSCIFCLGWGFFIASVLGIWAKDIAGLFNSDMDVVSLAVLYMYVIPVSYGFRGIIVVSSAAFNGLGKPRPSVIIMIARMIVVYVPLAIAGKYLIGVAGIFSAATISNFALGILSYFWAKKTISGFPEGV